MKKQTGTFRSNRKTKSRNYCLWLKTKPTIPFNLLSVNLYSTVLFLGVVSPFMERKRVQKCVHNLGANQKETSKSNPHYQAGNNGKDETCETFGEIPWAVVSERSRADFNCSPETQAKFFDYALGRFGLEFRNGGSVRETERKQGLLHLYNAENKRRFGGPLNGIFQHFPNVMGHWKGSWLYFHLFPIIPKIITHNKKCYWNDVTPC